MTVDLRDLPDVDEVQVHAAIAELTQAGLWRVQPASGLILRAELVAKAIEAGIIGQAIAIPGTDTVFVPMNEQTVALVMTASAFTGLPRMICSPTCSWVAPPPPIT